ncbi:recombinase family protein [Caballeronia sp. ATUFL_F1_KS39]|uniref:recombinase family protein n=1 Tax=Caballeronia sp. ATUFL_F1_KS39 TaxID=2921766 RepID=UPI002028C457|nr:recombinase family protein [Caballeronia sp. ATUFL_F1_KS39]
MTRAKKATVAANSAKPRVYSYLRFSNMRQKAGTSMERQLEYATKWATERGLELDTNLVMRDEGRSAYHGEHIKRGALGRFLEEIENGTIPPGSILIVEALDRLSRETVPKALTQLLAIIARNIAVVTLADNREYSGPGIEKNPMDLMFSIMLMAKAREEIQSRATRIRDAARIRATTFERERKRVAVGKDPGWVRYKEETNEYELVPEFVTPLMALIRYFRGGASMRSCFKMLREDGIPLPPPRVTSKGRVSKSRHGKVEHGLANTSRLVEMLSNRALIGEKIIVLGRSEENPDGESLTIKNYYPPLMTEAEFEELQQLRTVKGRTVRSSSRIVGVINGINITKCMVCGMAMGAQNALSRNRRADGLPQDGHRRLACTGIKKTDVPCPAGSFSIVPIERAIMNYCSDQMNLSALFVEQNAQRKSLNGELALALAQVAKTKAMIQKLLDLVEQSDDNDTDVYRERVKQRKAEQKQQEQHVLDLKYRIESVDRAAHPKMAEVWRDLREGVERLDNQARTKARQLVFDTFAEIRIKRTKTNADVLMIVLRSRRDVIRVFYIDRKTGERVRDETVEEYVEELTHRRSTRRGRAAPAKAA